jgi:hypothetical protein
MKCAAAK